MSCKALDIAQQKGIDSSSEIGQLKKKNYELAASVNEYYLNLVAFLNLIYSSRK